MSETIFAEYPVPLRGGTVIAKLRLPLPLTQADVDVILPIIRAIAEPRG